MSFASCREFNFGDSGEGINRETPGGFGKEAAAPPVASGCCCCFLSNGGEKGDKKKKLDILKRKTGLSPRNSTPLISRQKPREVWSP